MSEQVLFVDGVDIGSVGFRVVDLADWWSGISETRRVVSPYGALRSYAAPAGTVGPKEWPLGLLWAGERDDRVAGLDVLRRLLPLGATVVMRLGDAGRVAFGRRRGDVTQVRMQGRWDVGDVLVRVPIVFDDPAKYDVEETVTPLDQDPAVVDAGTLPCDWQVEIDGPATDPAIVVSEVTPGEGEDPPTVGDPVYTLQLEGEILEGESWLVDFGAHAITLLPAGAYILDALPLGGGEFQRLGTGAEEQVAVHLSEGSGTMRHTRRWG